MGIPVFWVFNWKPILARFWLRVMVSVGSPSSEAQAAFVTT